MANALCSICGHKWGETVWVKGLFRNDSYIPDHYERICTVCAKVEVSDKPFDNENANDDKAEG